MKLKNQSKDKNFLSFHLPLLIQGYTLIEVLVAVAIFFILIAAPTGLFISSIRGQTRALVSRELIDNSSFVLEHVSRALRMAKKDDIGGVNCLPGGTDNENYRITHAGSGIKFRSYEDECQEFYLSGGRVQEKTNGGPLPLTSDDLEVSQLKFVLIDPLAQEDDIQPRVIMFMEINKLGQPEIKVAIQTTISQRNLDVVY